MGKTMIIAIDSLSYHANVVRYPRVNEYDLMDIAYYYRSNIVHCYICTLSERVHVTVYWISLLGFHVFYMFHKCGWQLACVITLKIISTPMHCLLINS